VSDAAIITGATGSMGRALCHAFDQAGYFVIATDKRPDADVPFPYIPCDLEHLPHQHAEQGRLLKLIDTALEGRALKVCVNNAAVQILGSVGEIPDRDFQRTLTVNLVAPFVLTRLLLSHLEAAHGNVVNIGSIHALATKPGFVSYATSKAALLGLTRAMAVDLGPRLRVNIIQPAAVATEMLVAGFADNPDAFDQLSRYHPVGRIGECAEIASLAVFLASDAAKFISGASVNIDGGIGVRLHDPG